MAGFANVKLLRKEDSAVKLDGRNTRQFACGVQAKVFTMRGAYQGIGSNEWRCEKPTAFESLQRFCLFDNMVGISKDPAQKSKTWNLREGSLYKGV